MLAAISRLRCRKRIDRALIRRELGHDGPGFAAIVDDQASVCGGMNPSMPGERRSCSRRRRGLPSMRGRIDAEAPRRDGHRATRAPTGRPRSLGRGQARGAVAACAPTSATLLRRQAGARAQPGRANALRRGASEDREPGRGQLGSPRDQWDARTQPFGDETRRPAFPARSGRRRRQRAAGKPVWRFPDVRRRGPWRRPPRIAGPARAAGRTVSPAC